MKPFPVVRRHAVRWSLAALLLAGSSLPGWVHPSLASSAESQAVEAAAASKPVFYPLAAHQAQIGKTFTYQVAANNGPVTYAAANLPDGLAIDTASGLISGTPTTTGTFNTTLSATNANGATQATLTLTIILPPPVVTLTADVTSAYPAQGIIGDFVLARTGDISVPLTVNLMVQGSAKNGVDYVMTNTAKKFKPGKASKHIKIQAMDESGQGIAKKAVKITVLPSADYVLGTGTTAKVRVFYTP